MAGFNVGSLYGFLGLDSSKFDQGILAAQRSLDLTARSAVKTGEAVGVTETALTGAGKAASLASSGQAKLRAAQLSALAASERYNALLGDEGAKVARLASAEASLIRANERVAASTPTGAIAGAAAAAEKSTGFFATAGSKAAGFAGSMAKLGLGLAAFDAAVKAVDMVKTGAEFQRTMLLIQTNANASAGEVRDMSAAILKLSPQVATGPEDLANALYHVEQNGLRGTAALDALRYGAEGAKVGIADVEDTTNAMTFAIASGIKGVGDMSKAMGFLITTVGVGDMRMSDLNEALGTGILSVAKGFGASLQDVSAVLATLGDNGIRGADAAQGLRQTLMGFAAPAARGKQNLDSLGLSMTSLADDMEKHGLVHAMNDLNDHMAAAGITGKKVGSFITETFGRRAGASLGVLLGEMDRVNTKFGEVGKGADSFASKWQATTHTVAFSFQRLAAEAQVAGVTVFEKLGPPIGKVAGLLADDLPKAVHVVTDALHPFVTAWDDVSKVLGPVGHAAEDVGHFLKPVGPVVKDVATATLAMWAAFKGYQVARLAVFAVEDTVAALGVNTRNALTSVQASMASTASESTVMSRVMQAEFTQIEAKAMQDAAVHEQAGARIAAAYADQVSASSASTDKQVANAAELSAAQSAAARVAVESSATTSAAANAAATDVTLAGDEAAVGWAGLAGPLGIAAIGVLTLVSLFHKSSTASKEAADAAKAYTDALSSGHADVIDSITKQLSDNDVPQKIDDLNKQLRAGATGSIPITAAAVANLNKQFGSATFGGQDFVKAIEQGGKPLDRLRAKLQAVIAAGSGQSPRASEVFNRNGVAAAQTLLADLDAQYGALSKSQRQQIADFKQLGMSAVPIQKVADKTHLASQTAQNYAQMLGLAVTKSGDVIGSSSRVTAAVQSVANAYNHASQAGDALLSEMNTFSQTSGTAADRAKLIGSTLQAANGDALNFAAAMTGSTSAVDALTGAFAQQRQTLAQQAKDAQKAADAETKAGRAVETAHGRVAAAQSRLNQVRGDSKSTTAQVKAAEASVTSAQNTAADAADRLSQAQTTAGQKGALAYRDTESAALRFKKSQDGLRASIDTSAKGAGDLVSQLQGIQTAAVTSAGAIFQHEGATKKAADDAYKLYVNQTKGVLIDNRKQLGLTKDQAKALAKQYLDTPKRVKTLIEAEGTDPVVTVLDKIGKLLANLTGQKWNAKVSVNVDTLQITAAQKKIDHLVASGKHVSPALTALATNSGHRNDRGLATGGPVLGSGPRGVDSVPLLGAPGEFMMNDKAVSRFGLPFMSALNAGVLRLPIASPAAPARPQPAGDGLQRAIETLAKVKPGVSIGKLEQNNYVTSAHPSTRLPTVTRRAAVALGRP